MTARLADLEAMVQASWHDPEPSRDELRAWLEVYADELQQLGDPRGELIALDLLRTPTTDDRMRLDELTAELFGEKLARHPNVHTRYGLVGVSITDRELAILGDVLASSGAPFLSSVSIFGDATTVRRTLATLALEVRPWLGALRIVVPMPPPGVSFAQPVVEPELAAGLVGATPHLRTLSIAGEAVLRELEHPALRRLVVAGPETFGPLLGLGAPTSAVELDFAFQTGERFDASPATIAKLFPVASLPALRRLDLSRNEPGYHEPANLGGTIAMFRFVRSLAIVRQLTQLRLPAVRSEQDRELLQSTLDLMPALERLEVTHLHGRVHHGLRHPTATIAIPTSTPWPAGDVEDGGLYLELPPDREIAVELRELVLAMERRYDALPVEARLVWDDWWAAIAEHRATHAPFDFPASALLAALESCAPTGEAWRVVVEALRQARADHLLDDTVRISRL